MIQARALTLILTIILVVTVGGWPAAAKDSPRFSVAQAQSELQSKLHTLIDKLRGADMPAGVVKTNGRIEATQVDVAAKYPGRLESVMVQEGDEVGAGQIIAVISSPEYEAQLRGAQAQVLKAKQALAEAEAMIAERQSDQIAAKNDLQRGQDLVEKGWMAKQVFDQRQPIGALQAQVAADHGV